VTIQGIPGTLSRAGSVYTFTRTTGGSATAVATGFIFFTTAVTFGLQAGSQGLSVSGSDIGLLPTGSDIDLAGREIYDLSVRNLASNQYNFTHTWDDPAGEIAIAVDDKKRIIGPAMRAGICQDAALNMFFAKTDANGIWQIYKRNPAGVVSALTSGTVHSYSPSISANGLSVLFCQDDLYTQTYHSCLISTGVITSLEVYKPVNKFGLQVVGQSLGVGTATGVRITSHQPFQNKMVGANVRATATLTTLNPLIEGDASRNLESMLSAWANQSSYTMERLDGVAPEFIGMNSAYPGASLAQISKGGNYQGYYSFTNAIAHVTAANTLEANYEFFGVALVHGETDESLGTATYATDTLALYNDYNTDIKAITGQAADIKMFTCQTSSATYYNKTEGMIPPLQLQAAEDNPTKIFMVCPKYFLEYADGLHLRGEYQRILGQYYAKALRAVYISGTWKPLSPLSVDRASNVITIVFNVPVGPIVFDTTVVSNPGNYGFTYTDDASSATVSSVAIVSANTIEVTLSATPTGANKKIKYAMNGTSGNKAGPRTGCRGNLRDSDTTDSYYGADLYNWCVHFTKTVA
jgi:hypothetical protein